VPENKKQKLLNLIAERDKLIPEINSFRIVKDSATVLSEIKTTAEETTVKKELKNEGVTVFKFSWINTSINYQRYNYKTYDGDLSIDERIDERSFDGLGFSVGYNLFWQRNPGWIEFLNKLDKPKGRGLNSIYFSVNYTLSRSNNYASIQEQKLNIINSYTLNDTVYQFSSEEKLRNVSGKPFKTFLSHRIGLQFTGMIGKKQFFGINIVPAIEFSEDEDAKIGSRVGALFKFKDSADQKAKVNFELFISLDDWADTKTTDKSAWERKTIGLSASVPLQKVFFK
jgi:hypothetical protein